MKTTAKSFLHLVLVAGGAIAKSSVSSSTSCRWLVAVAFRAPSDHDRFFGKKPKPLNVWLPLTAFFLSRSRCSFRPLMVSTTFNWTWWHLSRFFFYQSVLLDARRWSTEFYCNIIPTDRTAFGIRTWPRLVLPVGLRLVFFGGDGVWAKCQSNLAMPRLAWLVFCWRCPFVLFNEDAFLCNPTQEKNRFCGPFLARGSSSEPPNPCSNAPADHVSLNRSLKARHEAESFWICQVAWATNTGTVDLARRCCWWFNPPSPVFSSQKGQLSRVQNTLSSNRLTQKSRDFFRQISPSLSLSPPPPSLSLSFSLSLAPSVGLYLFLSFSFFLFISLPLSGSPSFPFSLSLFPSPSPFPFPFFQVLFIYLKQTLKQLSVLDKKHTHTHKKTLCLKGKLHYKIISLDLIKVFFRGIRIRWWWSDVNIRTGRRSNRQGKIGMSKRLWRRWCDHAIMQGHASDSKCSLSNHWNPFVGDMPL